MFSNKNTKFVFHELASVLNSLPTFHCAHIQTTSNILIKHFMCFYDKTFGLSDPNNFQNCIISNVKIYVLHFKLYNLKLFFSILFNNLNCIMWKNLTYK